MTLGPAALLERLDNSCVRLHPDVLKVRTSSSSCSVRTTTSRPAMPTEMSARSLSARSQSDHQPCTPSLQHGRSGCADLTYGIDDGGTQALGAQHRFLQVPERLDVVLGRAPLHRSKHGGVISICMSDRVPLTGHSPARLPRRAARTVRSTRAALMPALIIASRVSTLRQAGPSVQMTAGEEWCHRSKTECARLCHHMSVDRIAEPLGTSCHSRSAVRKPRSGGAEFSTHPLMRRFWVQPLWVASGSS